MIRLVVLGLLLTGCAPRPQPHLHLDTQSGQVTPSASTNLGGISLGVSPYGGRIGTRIGGLGLSAGF